jgi:hypothetical protein
MKRGMKLREKKSNTKNRQQKEKENQKVAARE